MGRVGLGPGTGIGEPRGRTVADVLVPWPPDSPGPLILASDQRLGRPHGEPWFASRRPRVVRASRRGRSRLGDGAPRRAGGNCEARSPRWRGPECPQDTSPSAASGGRQSRVASSQAGAREPASESGRRNSIRWRPGGPWASEPPTTGARAGVLWRKHGCKRGSGPMLIPRWPAWLTLGGWTRATADTRRVILPAATLTAAQARVTGLRRYPARLQPRRTRRRCSPRPSAGP